MTVLTGGIGPISTFDVYCRQDYTVSRCELSSREEFFLIWWGVWGGECLFLNSNLPSKVS